jgi:hypothetical protein
MAKRIGRCGSLIVFCDDGFEEFYYYGSSCPRLLGIRVLDVSKDVDGRDETGMTRG